jgi:O-antigen/teichoic acid export membrane protein
VQAFFSKDETGFYGAAGMIGRALVFFALPLGQVLFPKVVAAKTRAEALHVLWQALALTGGVTLAGCVFCTVFRELPIRLIQGPTFVAKSAPLVPWFVWSMLPLALVNVLVNFLLAKRYWRALPVLIAFVLLYLGGLWGLLKLEMLSSFVSVLQIIGVFNLTLLAVSAAFVWLCERTVGPQRI